MHFGPAICYWSGGSRPCALQSASQASERICTVIPYAVFICIRKGSVYGARNSGRPHITQISGTGAESAYIIVGIPAMICRCFLAQTISVHGQELRRERTKVPADENPGKQQKAAHC